MDILLIMCPQNAFFDKAGTVYMGEKADVLRVRLKDYLSTFSGTKIFFREKHAEADSFFVNDKTHCIVNTTDFMVVDELRPFANLYCDKTRYSGFFGTNLEDVLKKEKVKSVGIVGVETHTSILYTLEELRNRDYDVTIIEPLVASRDDFMHSQAISMMVNWLGAHLDT